MISPVGSRTGWHYKVMHSPGMLLAALVVVLWGCGGPVAVFPGGVLDGQVKSMPQSFAFARDAGTIQLETRPDDPYSVNIACVVVGDALYVSAGDNKARWVENMEASPLVRLRIDGVVYELRAPGDGRRGDARVR